MIEVFLAGKSEFATLPGMVLLTFDGGASMRITLPAAQAVDYTPGRRYSVVLTELAEPEPDPEPEE